MTVYEALIRLHAMGIEVLFHDGKIHMRGLKGDMPDNVRRMLATRACVSA